MRAGGQLRAEVNRLHESNKVFQMASIRQNASQLNAFTFMVEGLASGRFRERPIATVGPDTPGNISQSWVAAGEHPSTSMKAEPEFHPTANGYRPIRPSPKQMQIQNEPTASSHVLTLGQRNTLKQRRKCRERYQANMRMKKMQEQDGAAIQQLSDEEEEEKKG